MEPTTSPVGLNATDPDARLRTAARLAVGAWVQFTDTLQWVASGLGATSEQSWQDFGADLIELRRAMADLASAHECARFDRTLDAPAVSRPEAWTCPECGEVSSTHGLAGHLAGCGQITPSSVVRRWKP